MFSRRSAVAAAFTSAAIPFASLAQVAGGEQADALRMLIERVVQDGEVSLLPELVAEDARLPDYDVEGVDLFMAVSQANRLQREADYSTYRFQIEAISEVDRWALAYVRFVAETIAGDEVDTPGFYAVHFNATGLIDEVYVGQ